MRWCDLKPLQSISSSSSLPIIFKFYKCNVMSPRYQANFFETREPRQKIKKSKYRQMYKYICWTTSCYWSRKTNHIQSRIPIRVEAPDMKFHHEGTVEVTLIHACRYVSLFPVLHLLEQLQQRKSIFYLLSLETGFNPLFPQTSSWPYRELMLWVTNELRPQKDYLS